MNRIIPPPIKNIAYKIVNTITFRRLDKKAAVKDFLSKEYPGYKIKWHLSSNIDACKSCFPDVPLYTTNRYGGYDNSINEKSQTIYMRSGGSFNLYYANCSKCKVVYWHVICW